MRSFPCSASGSLRESEPRRLSDSRCTRLPSYQGIRYNSPVPGLPAERIFLFGFPLYILPDQWRYRSQGFGQARQYPCLSGFEHHESGQMQPPAVASSHLPYPDQMKRHRVQIDPCRASRTAPQSKTKPDDGKNLPRSIQCGLYLAGVA